jgi:hypothetical protein
MQIDLLDEIIGKSRKVNNFQMDILLGDIAGKYY